MHQSVNLQSHTHSLQEVLSIFCCLTREMRNLNGLVKGGAQNREREREREEERRKSFTHFNSNKDSSLKWLRLLSLLRSPARSKTNLLMYVNNCDALALSKLIDDVTTEMARMKIETEKLERCRMELSRSIQLQHPNI